MTLPDWTEKTHEAVLEATNTFGFFPLLDMRVDTTAAGERRVHVMVGERLMQLQMIVHGGVIFTLADSAMGMTLLAALPPETRIGTIEAKVNFLLPVRAGELVAEARIVHLDHSIAALEATVHNIVEDGQRAVGRMMGTFSISKSQQAAVVE
jgi:acyl-CoA thioesterase